MTDVNLVLGADTSQVDKGVKSLDQLVNSSKRVATELAELARAEEKLWEQGTRLVLKLDDMIATFGLTSLEVLKFRAAQLGVTEAAAPMIASLEAMTAATKQYGVVITEVSQIEAARTRWEKTNLAELNGQRIDALATQARMEKVAAAELNGQRIEALSAQLAFEKTAQAELNGQRVQALAEQLAAAKSAQAELNGQRIEALAAQAALEKTSAAELNGQRVDTLAAQALIEKQASAELNGQRVQAKIDQLAIEKMSQAELNGQRVDALAAQALFEKQAAAELNGQRVQAKADQLALEKTSQAELNGQRIDALAAQVLFEKQAAAELNSQRLQAKADQLVLEKTSQAELNGQRIQALTDQLALEKTAQAELNGQRIQAKADQLALEKAALAELNGQRIDALASQALLEKQAMADLNGQRVQAQIDQAIREKTAAAELNGQRVQAHIERLAFERSAAAELNGQRVQALADQAALAKSAQTALNAQRIRSIQDNKIAEANAYFEGVNKQLAAAEKQALAEIKWAQMSTKAKIDEIKRLQAYQANSNITPATIERTFNPMAIRELGQLASYQKAYALELANTGHAHKKAKEHADTFSAALNGVSFSSSRARSEIIVLAHEMVQGRFSRMPASMMVLAEYTNMASIAFTGLGVVALTTAIAVAGVTYEIVKGANEQYKMAAALAITANYAGLTAESLNALAISAARANHGSIQDAKEVATELARSGKYSAESIGLITAAAVAMEHGGGQSIKETVGQFKTLEVQIQLGTARSIDSLIRAALKMDLQFHALTPTIIETANALANQGNQTAASELLIKAFSDTMTSRTKDIRENAGYIVSAWHGITTAVSGAVAVMREWGKEQGPAERLAKAKKELIDLKVTEALPITQQVAMAVTKPGGFIRAFAPSDTEEQIKKRIRDAEKDLADATTKAKKEQADTKTRSDATAAAGAIVIENTRLMKKSQDELNEALARYKKQREDIAKFNPKDPLLDPKVVSERIAAITREHTRKTPKSPGSSADRLLGAELRDTTSPMEEMIKAETKLLANRNRIIKGLYEDGTLALSDYIAMSKGARDDEYNAIVGDYDRQIAATETYLSKVKDAARRQRAETDLKDLKIKKSAFIDATGGANVIATQDDTKKLAEYTDYVERLNIQVLRLKNEFVAAADAEDQLANRINYKRADANVAAGMPKASDEKAYLQFLKERKIAEAEIQTQSAIFDLSVQKETTAEARLALMVAKGKMGEIEALAVTSQLRKEQLVDLMKTADAMELIAAKSGDPKLIANAQAFRLKIDEMANSADVLAKRMTDIVQGPFESFLTDVTSGTKSISQAFKDMTKSILNSLSQIASKAIANQIFGTMGGGSGGGGGGLMSGMGGMLGNLMGGGGFGMWGAMNSGVAASQGLSLMDLAGAFADGGDPPIGRPSLVGERGPEIFVPKTAGTILPNGVMPNAGKSGDTVNLTQQVNFHVNGAPTRESQAQMAGSVFGAGQRMMKRNA